MSRVTPPAAGSSELGKQLRPQWCGVGGKRMDAVMRVRHRRRDRLRVSVAEDATLEAELKDWLEAHDQFAGPASTPQNVDELVESMEQGRMHWTELVTCTRHVRPPMGHKGPKLDLARYPQQAFLLSRAGTFFPDHVLAATRMFALGFVRQLFEDPARLPGFPLATPIGAAVCNVRDGKNVLRFLLALQDPPWDASLLRLSEEIPKCQSAGALDVLLEMGAWKPPYSTVRVRLSGRVPQNADVLPRWKWYGVRTSRIPFSCCLCCGVQWVIRSGGRATRLAF